MASSNSIKIRELQEQQRRNTADIVYQNRLAAVKEGELQNAIKLANETIRNNLRNYGINLEKNQITKLANDQLNDRELQKLGETIRNNLAQMAETRRHNMTEEELKATENEIKKMDSLLSNMKATGKDWKALLTSFILNNTMMQAFTGQSVASKFLDWAVDTIFGDNQTPQDGRVYGPPSINQVEEEKVKYDYKNMNDYVNYSQNNTPYAIHNSKQRSNKRWYDKKSGEFFDSREEYLAAKHNEIPADYSNSAGPGGRNEKSNVKTQSSQTSRNSGSTRVSFGPPVDYGNQENSNPQQSDGSTNQGTSNIIWSGNSKEGGKTGPGIGLFD